MTKNIVEVNYSDLEFIFTQIENVTGQDITDAEREQIQNNILENNRAHQNDIDINLLIYKKLCEINVYNNLFGVEDADIDELLDKYEQQIYTKNS